MIASQDWLVVLLKYGISISVGQRQGGQSVLVENDGDTNCVIMSSSYSHRTESILDTTSLI